MSPLTIGVDARAANEDRAGRGRTTTEVLTHLAALTGSERVLAYTRAHEVRSATGAVEWRRIRGAGPWHLRAARDANRSCDVFLSTNSYITPLFLDIPTAVLVHDLVAFASFRLAHPRARLNEHVTLRAAIRRAARLICVSHTTRTELERRFPRAREKTVVAPLGVSDVFTRAPDPDTVGATLARYGIEKPFVLSVGTREPRKNHARLAVAFERLPAEIRERHELVLVGDRGWGSSASPPGAHVLGWVPDEDLAALYRACALFCYPSLHEGFGLPVAEAMSCGAAVAASNVSSLPEVARDAAAYFDPTTAESIAGTLEALLRDPARRQALESRGRTVAQELTWSRTASIIHRELVALVTDR